MEPLSLFTTNKERKWFFSLILLIFSLNIYFHYSNYQTFIKNEVFTTTGTIVNIYSKKNYDVLKINTDTLTFFTSIPKQNTLKKFDQIHSYIITKNIDFFSYLKGFYTKSFNIHKISTTHISTKERLYNLIASQHKNSEISSLYGALYLATPLERQTRELSGNLGISHLIAISGFHLGVMSFVLYFFIYLIYNKIHQKYIPYRNKRFDTMIFIVVILFIYLLFLDSPPSLLRAFFMFVFALYLLRNNIKVLSFETLFLITITIVAFFPKLLFSLSLWFSISGVFYIFLFIHYFKNLNKYLQILFFNFWIYFAMNPITHYFFGVLSFEQLFSPLLTLLFSIFYPLSVLLHIFNIGYLFDDLLQYLLDLNIYTQEVFTPTWLFYTFIILSLFSTLNTRGFIVLNIIIVAFNLWLFHFIF